MDWVFVGLIGLAALFGLGILVLEWSRPKPDSKSQKSLVAQKGVLLSAGSFDLPAVSSGHLIALNQKTLFLTERVSRVESILAQIPLDALKNRFDLADLEQKVDRLSVSRNEFEIELVAIRDALVAKGILKPKSLSTHAGFLEEEVKNRIFNSNGFAPPKDGLDSKTKKY